MEKGLLIVISGPAGSGKGTVNAQLLQTGDFAFSVSATTRAPRPGEVDGVNYYYITHEEFEKRIADGDMLEYTSYVGNYYGTPRKEAEAVLESGKNLILEIEVDGAGQVKSKFPEAVLIMLLPPISPPRNPACAAAAPRPRIRSSDVSVRPVRSSSIWISTTTSSTTKRVRATFAATISSPSSTPKSWRAEETPRPRKSISASKR
jgi:ribose 1,5-bisphosphokinase PhnN